MRKRARWIIPALVIGLGACEGGEQVEQTIEEIEETTGTDTMEAPFEEAHEKQRVVVQARSFAYQPSEITVAPGEVTFVINNAAEIVHGFEVEGHGMEEAIEMIDPGSTDSLTATFEQSGEYEIYCPVADHEQRGMTGVLTVE